jgi:hypothetical protein
LTTDHFSIEFHAGLYLFFCFFRHRLSPDRLFRRCEGEERSLNGEGRNWRASHSSYGANSCQVNSVPNPTSDILAPSTRTRQIKRVSSRVSVNTPFSYPSPSLFAAVNAFEKCAAFRQRDIFRCALLRAALAGPWPRRTRFSYCENIFFHNITSFHNRRVWSSRSYRV